MALKKTTFKRVYDEEHFVSEEWINDQGLVVYSKRIEEGHSGEFKAQYDDEGNKLVEEHWEEGELANRIEWHYFEKGRGVEKRTYYGEELYEREITTYNDGGHERRTIQEGEEIERMVFQGDEQHHTISFYVNGFLHEKQRRGYDRDSRQAFLQVTDANDIPGTRFEEEYDAYDRMMVYREFHNGGALFVRSAYTYEGERITSEQTENLLEGTAYQLIYTYDRAGNLIKEETQTLAGQLTAFHSYAYDERGRCVKEVIYSVGQNDTMMGGGVNKVHDTYVHYYEGDL